MERAKADALEHVAESRKLSGDPNRHRSKSTNRYDYGDNPDFDALRKRDRSGVLNSPELAKIYPAVRPIAYGTFKKYGISERDSEEVLSNCIQKLVMPKADGSATIDNLTVFEEVFPFFNKIVQNEAVDRVRRLSAKKNQANTQDSFDALQDDPDRPVQFADPTSALGAEEMPGFEEIYELCAGSLDESEWKLVAALYLGEKVTKNELLQQEDFLEDLGIAGGSHITRWRALSKKLGHALGKMRLRLEEEGYFFGNPSAELR